MSQSQTTSVQTPTVKIPGKNKKWFDNAHHLLPFSILCLILLVGGFVTFQKLKKLKTAEVFQGEGVVNLIKNPGFEDVATQTERVIDGNFEAVSLNPSPSIGVNPSSSPSPNPQQNISRQHTIGILSLAYFPIKDNMLDIEIVNNNWNEYNMTLEEVHNKVASLKNEVIMTLQDGSTYKKYKNSSNEPTLIYKIVKDSEFLEPIPAISSLKRTDYNKILSDQKICDLVDSGSIKEVWIWSYTGLDRTGWESNFSSSYGDISNSDRDPNDMPICKKSYTVYEYNYGRGPSEATEDHIHQYEAIFRYLNNDLFWNKYVGYFPGGSWGTAQVSDQNRRCGWAHYPPNANSDYDWTNSNSVLSDCMDWKPDNIGKQESINCDLWHCDSREFFVFWMQNIPGKDNDLSYQDRKLRNWWDFIGDFDNAMLEKKDLVY